MTQTKAKTAWIRENLPDYPYELFFDETEEGMFECLIDGCNKEFNSYQDYLEHFLYNNQHTSFIKRNLMKFSPREDLGEEIVWDPIEKKQIELEIKNNPDYAALEYGRDVTHLLEEKIKFSVKHNRNIIAEVLGIPGTGKSWATIALAYIISGHWAEKLQEMTSVGLDFEQSDILEMIGRYYKGDTLIQDEDPMGFGAGSKTNEEAFENLCKTLRKKCITLLIVSPTDTRVENVNFTIQFFAYYPKERVTKGILLTRKGIALGYVYVEILDDEDYVEYEKKKDTFIDKMHLSGGFGVVNYNDARCKRDFEILLKAVTEIEPEMKRGDIVLLAGKHVRGDGNYQKIIALDVYFKLKYDVLLSTEIDKGSGGIGDKKLDWELLETIEDDEIGDLIYEHSRPKTRQQKLGHAWWKYYFCTEDAKGQQAADFINEEFDESNTKQAYYNTFFPKFTENEDCFGKAIERAVQERYYPDYKIDGRTGKPDLIGETDYKEVKGRKKGTTRDIYGYFKKKSYIWDFLNRGEDVKLIEVIYAPKRRFTIKVYQLMVGEESDK